MSPDAVRQLRVLLRQALEIIDQGAPEPELPRLSPTQRHILAMLTDRPQSAQRLAARSGHRSNTYFRDQLGVLVDAGLVRHVRRGYRRP
jgi:hypothetical protein